MEKARWKGTWSSAVALVAIVVQLFFLPVACSQDISSTNRNVLRNVNDVVPTTSPGVKLDIQNHREGQEVVISNGFAEVTLLSPDGEVTGIKYNGIENLLQTKNNYDRRGYWDVVWSEPGDRNSYDKIIATEFRVIMEDENQVELSFTRTWNISLRGAQVPLNVDKRYIMRRGSSGFYFYAIMERKEGWPDVYMDQIRAVFRLQESKFRYMALSDDRQRIMPMPEDRESGRQLAYPEAVLLTNPTNHNLTGEVDDKYQFSCENKDNRVHGWICNDPPVGFWVITPSDEFRISGPLKQELTSHVGPVALSMFTSKHYTGREVDTYFESVEPWKKVMGPVFVYLNSVSSHENPLTLWEDAKQQMLTEVGSWPYDFPQSTDFLKSNQRGNVSGQLQVHDRYLNDKLIWAKSAYVGLAAPGDVGSWQRETKGYQFWTQADENGNFSIENVREGDYNLYAWVPGVVGDYKYNLTVAVKPGSKLDLGVLVYKPPRNGPTLWEIGVPDRSAAEFYVPNPDPNFTTQLYKNHPEKFRQYGLWQRYADINPTDDLQYNVGVSNYSRDWFFAHVTRKSENGTYRATTWQIVFELENLETEGTYTLQLALAAATYSNLQVRINRALSRRPQFSTGTIGKDNAIARHGIHGLYRFYSINVPSYFLNIGQNRIYLTQSLSRGPFQGLMYDYIRFEGPPMTEKNPMGYSIANPASTAKSSKANIASIAKHPNSIFTYNLKCNNTSIAVNSTSTIPLKVPSVPNILTTIPTFLSSITSI